MANVANDSVASASGAIAMARPAGHPFWTQDNITVARPGTTYTNASGTVSRPTSGQLFPRGVAAGEHRVT
jgi:hypothetical protein